MQTSNTTQRKTRRQTWLTASRIAVLVLLVAILAINVVQYNKSSAPVSSTEMSKVEAASRFIETAGFNNPVYLGIKFATEAEFPTFRAEAIGGEPVELLIRTTSNGGMEIQPTNIYRSVASAEHFAHIASQAVADWENIPAAIKPSTSGFGEYESRKLAYEQLAKYNPGTSYWALDRDEVSGWPGK